VHQTAKRAAGGFLSNLLGWIEPREAARDRIPVIALHVAGIILRDWHGGNRAIRTPVFADKSGEFASTLRAVAASNEPPSNS
jgi:hypothetical protein